MAGTVPNLDLDWQEVSPSLSLFIAEYMNFEIRIYRAINESGITNNFEIFFGGGNFFNVEFPGVSA